CVRLGARGVERTCAARAERTSREALRPVDPCSPETDARTWTHGPLSLRLREEVPAVLPANPADGAPDAGGVMALRPGQHSDARARRVACQQSDSPWRADRVRGTPPGDAPQRGGHRRSRPQTRIP